MPDPPGDGARDDAAAEASVPSGDYVEDMRVAKTLSERLAYHAVRLDAKGNLLSPFEGPGMYGAVSALAWGAMKRVPVLDNGYRTYLTHSVFVADPGRELMPPIDDQVTHTRAGLAAMCVDSALAYYSYSGDTAVLDLVREYLDLTLANGMTEKTDAWAEVPYATANPHEIRARGGSAGDGEGNIATDKVAELAVGFLKFYEFSGETKWRDAAVASARALAAHAKPGDERNSPWPYRLDAKTGTTIKERYTAHVIPAIALFDELARLGIAETGFADTRAKVWKWLFDYPFKNEGWTGYFEDMSGNGDPWQNTTQYISLETARWLLLHPEADPDSIGHARTLIDWTARVFTVDGPSNGGVTYAGRQYGAEVISEQTSFMFKMGSHTSRFGSVLALYYEKTNDAAMRERAFRSLNWATYLSSSEGIVSDVSRVIPPKVYSWFTDGYCDYIRHLLAAMRSVPAWAAPDQNHLLGSSSIVTAVEYGSDSVRYSTFDAKADDVLRLSRAPTSVSVGGVALGSDASAADHFVVRDVASGGVTLRVHRSGALTGEIRVTE